MASFRELYVFGDSASDVGSLAAALRRQTSPRGRYSGVTAHNTANNWQVLLRRRLNLPLTGNASSGFGLANRFVAPPGAGSAGAPSFAVSGATSGREHLAEFGDLRERLVAIAALRGRGLQGQIEAALAQGVRPGSGDLTLIWGGANDLLLGVREGRKPQKVVRRTVRRMLANVEVMLRSGEARQIVASALVPFAGEVNGVPYRLPYITELLRRARQGKGGRSTRAWADYFRSNGSTELLESFERGLERLRQRYPYAAIVGFRNEFESSWRRFGRRLGDFSDYGIRDSERAAQNSKGFADFSRQRIARFLHFDNVHFGESGNRMLARSLELTLERNRQRFTGAALGRRRAGGDGDDRLRGSRDNDLLIGGGGADEMLGRSGNDVLIGGPGGDRMEGGRGADAFLWRRGDLSGRPLDRIDDFNGGKGDRLAITALLDGDDPFANKGWRFIGADRFSGRARELRFSDGLLKGDVNGNGRAELRLRLAGVQSFSPDWIA
ncbi:MAG: SGNH/GDSL hydrolase family protein [Cyanobacteria bacterium J06638_7]